MLDPTTASKKWQTNLTNSTAAITAGVNAVTVSPTIAAAAAVSKWQAKLSSPDTATKFVNSLKAVSLQDWQTAMTTTGVGRIASGAQKGVGKYQTFATKFYPFLAQVQSTIKAMPSLTLQDNINRMVAQVNAVAQYKS